MLQEEEKKMSTETTSAYHILLKTQRNKEPKTQRLKGTKTPRVKAPKTQKNKDSNHDFH